MEKRITKPRKVGNIQKLENKTKQNPKKIDFTPVASRKEGNPADTLILGQWDPGWTSNLQTKIMLVFKPLSR